MLKSSEDGGIIGGLLFFPFHTFDCESLGEGGELLSPFANILMIFLNGAAHISVQVRYCFLLFFQHKKHALTNGEGRIQRDRGESELNIKLKYGAI